MRSAAHPPNRSPDWERVAAAVRDRRLELGLTQDQAAARAQVSLATWRLIESAGRARYQPLTLRGVTRALGWVPDAIEQLADGAAADELRAGAHDAHHTAPPDGGGDRRGGDHRGGDDPPTAEVPAGLARKWGDLTDHERAQVQGFVDGLLAGRRDDR